AVFHEGSQEQDGNLDYGLLTELSNVALIDSVLGQGMKQGYSYGVDAKRLGELRSDLSDARVANDLERARAAAARGDREGARAALEAVKQARDGLEYTAADGRVERRSVDELERELTSGTRETRARAEKFAAAAVVPVGK